MATQSALPANKRFPFKRKDDTPENLLRSLVAQVANQEILRETNGISDGHDCEEIILDSIVDGAHYLLIRLPRVIHNPVRLSPREREIVRMVAQGHPNKIIADVLNISSWTVCTHLRRIFAKLGVGSRAAMVARMMETREQIKPWPSPAERRNDLPRKPVASSCANAGGAVFPPQSGRKTR